MEDTHCKLLTTLEAISYITGLVPEAMFVPESTIALCPLAIASMLGISFLFFIPPCRAYRPQASSATLVLMKSYL